VIGGIVVFEGCSRVKSGTSDMASKDGLPGESSDMTSASNQVTSIPSPQGTGPGSSLVPPNSMAGNEGPAPAPVAVAPAPVTGAHTYVVKKGDSLWKIAKAENITVRELSRANNMTKTSTLKVGQKLTVPAVAKAEKTGVATASVVPTSTDANSVPSTTTAAATPAAATEAGEATYTVKSGDSLWKIARQKSVSVAALKQANNLSGDSLKVGQTLHIPTATAKTVTDSTGTSVSAGIASTGSPAWQAPGTYTENGQTIHVVDFNESPGTIAKKYGVKLDDLLKANNITDSRKVQYGQRLVIPVAQPSASAPAATTPAANTTSTAAAAPAAPALAAPVVSASRATAQ
jgi:LysM repeat protein